MRARKLLGCVPLLIISCGGGTKPPAQGPASSPAGSIAGHDWVLIELGEKRSLLGAGDRPVTLRFDGASSRATGFAGCNRYSASYQVHGDTLSFGPVAATKMACAQGDQLERDYLAVLPAISSYGVSDSGLTLRGGSGPTARFRAASE
jgi:heat shock protein HslJ